MKYECSRDGTVFEARINPHGVRIQNGVPIRAEEIRCPTCGRTFTQNPETGIWESYDGKTLKEVMG